MKINKNKIVGMLRLCSFAMVFWAIAFAIVAATAQSHFVIAATMHLH